MNYTASYRDEMSSPKSLTDGSDEDDYPYWEPEEVAPLRVIENYTDTVYRFIGADAAAKLRSQIEMDKQFDPFTPMMIYDSGTESDDENDGSLTETTNLGIIKLGKVVHKGFDSVVFEIERYPDLLIKYQLQCDEFDFDIHPLLRDFWYMQEAAAWDLAPRAIFLSPQGQICLEKTGKCRFFKMSPSQLGLCVHKGGVARYMIMERVKGMTLNEARTSIYGSANGAMNILNAFKISYAVMHTLARLHEKAQVVHGDIHTGNIMFDPSIGKIQLIDFGRAFRRTRMPERPIYRQGANNEYMNSLWQIEGYDWAARDDVIKTIQMLAHLMHPFSYHLKEKEMEKRGVAALCKWKKDGDWFRTDAFDPIGGTSFSTDVKNGIRDSLANILRIGRSLEINQRIPYQTILNELALCSDLVRGAMESYVTTTLAPIGDNNTTTTTTTTIA